LCLLQYGPLDAIQSVHDAEAENVAQPWVYYISTKSSEEIFRSHRESRAHDHEETIVCLNVLATPELHRVVQEREYDGTGRPRHYLNPEIAKDWLRQNNLDLDHEIRRHLAQKWTMRRQQELGDAEEDDDNIGGVALVPAETLRPIHTEPTPPRNEVPCNPIAYRGSNCNVRRVRKRSQSYAGNTESSSIDPEGVPTPLATNSAPHILARTWTTSAISVGRSFRDAMPSLPSMLLSLSNCVIDGLKGANPLFLAALLFYLATWALLCNF
jgi:hypothetical protein